MNPALEKRDCYEAVYQEQNPVPLSLPIPVL
jgi:hypothetical protein